jgi:CheY-like chemotaxis protein
MKDTRQSLQLLLVDDDRVTAGLLHAMLERQSVRVTHALDGQNIIQLLSSQRFDLALIDLRLPLTTGWHVIREIRSEGWTLPIYLTSALYTDQNAPYDAITTADANGFLPKPIRREALLELLARHQQPSQPQKIPL